MTNTEKLLIEILRAFVNDRKPVIETEYNAEALYELAKSQSITGIVSYVLHKYGREDILIGDKRLSDAYDKTVAQLIRKDVETQMLFGRLTAADIPHITFKGMVIKDCYPVPELRTFGDIDVIIREEDRKKSHELMLAEGFKGEAMDGGVVYGYKRGKEFYELHSTMNSERTKLSDFMADYWSRTTLRSGLTYEFEKNFHFAYLISHIEKHVNCSNAGVRLYLDIALFLKKYRDELDLEKVRGILKDCKLEKFYDTVLYLCYRWFGTEKLYEQELSDELYEEFCRFTLRGGTFGVQNAGADSEGRRAMSNSGEVSKVSLIIRHVFPPYREVRRMYPFFDGKPYLLPLSWVIHPFAAAKRSGLNNLKRVANADINEAKKEKELLRQVGSER